MGGEDVQLLQPEEVSGKNVNIRVIIVQKSRFVHPDHWPEKRLLITLLSHANQQV